MNNNETRNYETIFILDSVFEDEKVEAIVSKYNNFLTKNGGELKTSDKWGRKKLAYPIKKRYTGHYVSIEFSAAPDLIAKLERAYHLDDDILRFLTVSFDKKTFVERKAYFDKKQQDAANREKEAAALREQQAASAEQVPETKQQ